MKLPDVKDKIAAAVATISGMSFLYGEVWEMNEIANKNYPIIVMIPPNSAVTQFPYEDYSITLIAYQENKQDAVISIVEKQEDLKDWLWTVIDYVNVRSASTEVTCFSKDKNYKFTLYENANNDKAVAVSVEFILRVKECRT